MPAGGGEIIREFLVGLGFSVNDTQLRSFNYAINRVASITLGTMGKMGAGVTIAAASIGADILLIANNLQKLYYASKLSGASATNIKALQEGAKQVGVSVEDMTKQIVNFGYRLKTDIALPSLVKGLLGVETQGRDAGQVIVDIVDKLKTLPPWLQQIYEGLLGLDPTTFYLLTQGADQFKAAIQQTKDQLKAAGINMDDEARKAKDLENRISELRRQWDILSVSMESWAVGPATKVIDALNKIGRVGDTSFFNKLWYGNQGKPEVGTNKTLNNLNLMKELWYGRGVSKEQFKRETFKDRFFGSLDQLMTGPMPPALRGVGGPPNLGDLNSKAALQVRARQIAAIFGLDPDLMVRLIQQESRFKPGAVNKKSGATGLMQLMAGTAAEYGVLDRTNPEQSMMGGMAYFRDLLNKYKGNIDLALAEYNAGPVAMKKYGGIPPFAETQNYIRAIHGTRLGAGNGGGVSINQKTDIHVNGAGDPRAVGAAVATEQNNVNSTILRNAGGNGQAR